MRSFSFIVILFLLVSCSENNSRQIELFNDINITLLESETVVEVNAENQADYASTFSEHSFQIPLFKTVTGSGYIIYIGLPFNTNLASLTQFPLISNDSIRDSQIEPDKYYHKQYQSGDQYITEYAVDYETNLVYFLIKTDSAEVADSLFNYSSLAGRIK